MNKKILFIVLCFFLTANLSSQTPQYYTSSTAGSANAFPFGIAQGKKVQMIYLPNDFNLPTPCPSGSITIIYFKMSASVTATFTNLTVRMGQSTITELPVGVFYTGQLDTVYNNPSATLTAVNGNWMSITLNTPYVYDSTKSLIVEVQQCGASSGGMNAGHLSLAGNRRSTSLINTSCPFNWGQQSGTIAILGINFAPLGINPVSSNIPNEYSLQQNYPNPFNPNTQISFDIKKSGLVKLAVYDILGKEISVLVNDQMGTGTYSVNFDASDLPSGLYVYTLRINEFSESRKMMLIK